MTHPFAPIIQTLGRGKKGSRSLTQEEAQQAMAMILADEVDPMQLGAFLMLLRVKEESPEEMAGMVQAVRAALETPSLSVSVDWPCYAGKRRHLPWYVLAMKLVSHAGFSVFSHGTHSHTPGRIYTQDAFDYLGWPIANNWQDAEAHLKEHGLVYFGIEQFCPKLEQLLNLKPILGLRSPVNSFVRMLNPLNAPLLLQGVFHPAYNGIHQRACAQLNYPSTLVIKGDGGEFERNPEMKLTSYLVRQGEESEEHWPILLPKREVKPEQLALARLKAVWLGDEPASPYEHNAIVGTTALVLSELMSLNQEVALKRAQGLWEQRHQTAFSN